MAACELVAGERYVVVAGPVKLRPAPFRDAWTRLATSP